MLPRYHILLGAIFTLAIWYFAPNISLFYLFLVFLSSFLIDIDHYLVSVFKTKKIRLKYSFKYHTDIKKQEIKEKEKGIRKKGDFHLFHTVEFHLLIGILGMLWTAFFFVFVGMIFHSILDLFYMLSQDRFYRREYFFFNWLRKKLFT